jgi:hypothetical protein
VNTLEELDKLHNNLTETLKLWRRKFATEIGEGPFRECEKVFYDVSDAFGEYLNSVEAKSLTDSARESVAQMNGALDKTAGQLRMLADSLRTYRPPEPGGRASDFADQDAMNNRLEAIRESIKQILGMIEQNRKVFSRSSGGSGNRSAPQRDPGYFWPNSRAAGAEDVW